METPARTVHVLPSTLSTFPCSIQTQCTLHLTSLRFRDDSLLAISAGMWSVRGLLQFSIFPCIFARYCPVRVHSCGCSCMCFYILFGSWLG